jgi:hypothetical protein
MEARKLMFPILLAIVWVAMAAMALVDFAQFTSATQKHLTPPVAAAPAPARTSQLACAPLSTM